MKNRNYLFLSVVCLCFFSLAVFCANTVQAQMTEEAKIEALIASLENLPAKTLFIRNGSSYGGEQAAAHLRSKYRNGKRYAKTAELFIENLASKSSMSGEEYSIMFIDGSTVSAREFLTEQLQKLEAADN